MKKKINKTGNLFVQIIFPKRLNKIIGIWFMSSIREKYPGTRKKEEVKH